MNAFVFDEKPERPAEICFSASLAAIGITPVSAGLMLILKSER